jgi:translation initiation factor 1 (eIF-1/SUI1)
LISAQVKVEKYIHISKQERAKKKWITMVKGVESYGEC